jgi:hypothetical protein
VEITKLKTSFLLFVQFLTNILKMATPPFMATPLKATPFKATPFKATPFVPFTNDDSLTRSYRIVKELMMMMILHQLL